jgi:hypothetical protein
MTVCGRNLWRFAILWIVKISISLLEHPKCLVTAAVALIKHAELMSLQALNFLDHSNEINVVRILQPSLRSTRLDLLWSVGGWKDWGIAGAD